MLYVFTGTDVAATRANAHDFLDAYEKKGATIEHIDAEQCSSEVLRDRIGAQSLFAGTRAAPEVTLIDTPSEQKGALEAVTELAPELTNSPNIFVLLEGKLLAAQAKPLKKHATEYNEVQSQEHAEHFNVFALADALARRDKKTLWVLLMRAKQTGLSAEKLIGTLFWQVKCMRLAVRTQSAEEAGLKPYVYSKAKRGAQKFTSEELDRCSAALIALYHEAHLGNIDIDTALERWVLEV